MLMHVRVSLSDSGFLVNIRIFAEGTQSCSHHWGKTNSMVKINSEGLRVVMSSRGGGSAALPAQLSLDFGLHPVQAQMVDVLLRSRGSRLGPRQALSSFLSFFIFRLKAQMSNWNRVFINISCLAIQE